MICGNCDKTDGLVYTSLPPKVRCEISKRFHETSDECDIEWKPIIHGHWNWFDGVRCSRCNYKLQTTGIPSYCPNCGAKMDEASE